MMIMIYYDDEDDDDDDDGDDGDYDDDRLRWCLCWWRLWWWCWYWCWVLMARVLIVNCSIWNSTFYYYGRLADWDLGRKYDSVCYKKLSVETKWPQPTPRNAVNVKGNRFFKQIVLVNYLENIVLRFIIRQLRLFFKDKVDGN